MSEESGSAPCLTRHLGSPCKANEQTVPAESILGAAHSVPERSNPSTLLTQNTCRVSQNPPGKSSLIWVSERVRLNQFELVAARNRPLCRFDPACLPGDWIS